MTRTTVFELLVLFSAFTMGCMPMSIKSDGCPIGFQRAAAGNCVQNLSCLEDEQCLTSGRCTYAHGNCVPTRQGDCAASQNCTKLGECDFRVDRQGIVGLCIASSGGCAASEVCTDFGKCSPGPKDFCIVESDADCEKSKICTEKERCIAKEVVRADGKSSGINACQRM